MFSKAPEPAYTVKRSWPLRSPGLRLQKSRALNGDLLRRFKLIWVVQSPSQKYCACAVGQISGTDSGRLASIRGTYASSRTLRWDAVDAKVLRDERHCRGRQKRVVLTPRRWCQVFARSDSRESDG